MKRLNFGTILSITLVLGLVAGAISEKLGWTPPASTATAALVLGGVAVASRYLPSVRGLHTAAISNLTNILHDEGADNMGGLQTVALYCLHSEVATHAKPKTQAQANSFEELVTVTSDHTFKSGKGWKKFYSTEDASFHANDAQGEIDGMSYHPTATLYHPLMGAKFLGWARHMLNRGSYWVVKDIEGLKRMLGSQGRPARIKVFKATTGTVAADRKGTQFEVHFDSNYPAPIVTASLAIESDDVGSDSATF